MFSSFTRWNDSLVKYPLNRTIHSSNFLHSIAQLLINRCFELDWYWLHDCLKAEGFYFDSKCLVLSKPTVNVIRCESATSLIQTWLILCTCRIGSPNRPIARNLSLMSWRTTEQRSVWSREGLWNSYTDRWLIRRLFAVDATAWLTARARCSVEKLIDAEYSTECWMLNAEWSMLNARYSMLDARCSMRHQVNEGHWMVVNVRFLTTWNCSTRLNEDCWITKVSEWWEWCSKLNDRCSDEFPHTKIASTFMLGGG